MSTEPRQTPTIVTGSLLRLNVSHIRMTHCLIQIQDKSNLSFHLRVGISTAAHVDKMVVFDRGDAV